jgi:hypothetical protein
LQESFFNVGYMAFEARNFLVDINFIRVTYNSSKFALAASLPSCDEES